jgi:hypothetical protein
MPNPAWRAAECLFTYALVDFELCEKLTRRPPNFSIFYVFKTLADALFRIDASGDILQLLIINASNIRHFGILVAQLFVCHKNITCERNETVFC